MIRLHDIHNVYGTPIYECLSLLRANEPLTQKCSQYYCKETAQNTTCETRSDTPVVWFIKERGKKVPMRTVCVCMSPYMHEVLCAIVYGLYVLKEITSILRLIETVTPVTCSTYHIHLPIKKHLHEINS